MPVPIVYRKVTEGDVLQFNFTDVASGTGYIRQFGIVNEDDEAFLTTNALSTSPDDKKGGTQFTISAGGPPTLVGEINFDLDFEQTQKIKGEILSNVSYNLNQTGSNDVDVFLVVKVFHVDSGATETQLGDSVTTDTERPGAGADIDRRFAISTTLARKIFRKGEKLRYSVEVWGNLNNGTSSNCTVYHDPAGEITTPVDSRPTTLIVDIPFEVSL